MTAPAATPPVHVPVVPFPLPNFQPPMQTYFPHQAGGIPGVDPTRAYAQPSFPPPNAPPFPYAAPPPQTFAAPPHNGHDSRVNHDPRRNTPNPNGPGPNLPSRPGFDGRDPRRSWQDTGSSNRDMRHNGKPGVDGPGSYANGTSDGFRGRGGARGRGRGRGQWEDRTSFDERRPPQKRERSMSPPHAGRGYGSPQGSDHDLSRPSINKAAAAATGKDEFGRDIRSGSPDAEDPVPVRSQPPRSSAVESTNATTASGASVDRPSNVPKPKHEPPSVQTIPVLYAQPGPAALPTPSVSVKPTPTGLHAFDFATFDFTNPESWTSLGQAWKVTNGFDPSQEQLMQFVMSGGPQALQDGQPAGEAIAQSAPIPNVHSQQWQSNYVQEPPQPLQQIGTYGDGMQQGSGTMGGFGGGGGHRGGRGGGRGRGNFRRNQEDYSAYSGTQSTDEFVVGIQPEANGNYMNQMNGYY
jgi:protein NRD1